jgi:hypothetical protein
MSLKKELEYREKVAKVKQATVVPTEILDRWVKEYMDSENIQETSGWPGRHVAFYRGDVMMPKISIPYPEGPNRDDEEFLENYKIPCDETRANRLRQEIEERFNDTGYYLRGNVIREMIENIDHVREETSDNTIINSESDSIDYIKEHLFLPLCKILESKNLPRVDFTYIDTWEDDEGFLCHFNIEAYNTYKVMLTPNGGFNYSGRHDSKGKTANSVIVDILENVTDWFSDIDGSETWYEKAMTNPGVMKTRSETLFTNPNPKKLKIIKRLKCASMIDGECTRKVTSIDNKGFVYCDTCAKDRRPSVPTRKLKKSEIENLLESKPIKY